MSVPSFFSAIIFAWIFGFLLKDFTGLEMTGSLFELDDYGESFNLKLKNLILPSIVLGIRPLAVISQLVRNELLNVLNQDYIRTAKAKGLSEFLVVYKHALRNALLPVVTMAGLVFSGVISGAVLVETVFSWPGLGTLAVQAIVARDTPTILGILFFSSLVVVVANLLTDLIYRIIDPRIRTSND
mgnify:CR=1 FL=1